MLKLIPNPNELTLQTRVNGDLRQNTNTSDMLFDVKTLVCFLSQGTTLEGGSIIMTGTPEGNAIFSSFNRLIDRRGGICDEGAAISEAWR
jgi:2-keto-4-pentenoate hydratase/2-oxohepta-3-ene-1,7-dioic acid hydratase in catechol pathway